MPQAGWASMRWASTPTKHGLQLSQRAWLLRFTQAYVPLERSLGLRWFLNDAAEGLAELTRAMSVVTN
jgi:hypothetical protein